MALEELKKALISGNVDSNIMENTIIELCSKIQSECDEKLQILLFDCIAIWITRCMKADKVSLATQFCTEYADMLLKYAIYLRVHETGPLANAVAGAVNKTIVILKKYHPSFQELCKKCLDISMGLPSDSKQKYLLAEKFGNMLESSYIASEHSQFVVVCMDAMSSNRLANAASKALLTTWKPLISKNTESAANNWIDIWFDTVISGLKSLLMRSNILTYLLPILFRIELESYTSFLSRISLPIGLDQDSLTDLKIGTLKIGQDLGLYALEKNTNTIMVPLLQHRKTEFRNRALHLLLESRRSKDRIDSQTYQILTNQNTIALFLLEIDTIESQNSFISTMRRFLIRIRDSCNTAEKGGSQAKKQKGNSPATVSEQLGDAKKFLYHLLEVCKHYIAPESSYVQHSCALQLLELFVETRIANEINEGSNLLVQNKNNRHNRARHSFTIDVFGPELLRLLLDDLTNNYKFIREHSAVLLLSYSPQRLSESIMPLANVLIDRSFIILADLKGRASEGGAFVFMVLTQIYIDDNNLDAFFEVWLRLLNLLRQDAKALMNGGLELGKSNHVHGILSALSMICQNTTQSGESKLTTDLLCHSSTILEYVTIIWKSARPILQSVAAVQEEDLMQEKKALTIGWKAVKESSKLLGTLMDMHTKIQQAPTQVWISQCAELLIDQLTTIKHRGAFSSVYPSFVALCRLCKTCFPDLPQQWLSENIEMIKNRDQLISRRSGGLPFLVTAVLVSSTNESNNDLHKKSLESLLSLAESPYASLEDGKRDLPQVHAFNILRQIFMDPTLSKVNSKYIGRTLILSLRCFTSLNWSIRNCAVMLFSTLHTRIFGKLEKYLAQQFFSMHKKLKNFLLQTLENLVASSDYQVAFPIMEIFCRISFLEYVDEAYEEIVSLLKECLKIKIWKVREKSALALSVVLNDNCRESYLNDLTYSIIESTDNNEAHGKLCTVFNLIETTISNIGELPDASRRILITNCSEIVTKNKCWAVRGKAAEIMKRAVEVLKDSDVDGELLFKVFQQESTLKEKSLQGPKKLFLLQLLQLLLEINLHQDLQVDEVTNFVVNLNGTDELMICVLEFLTLHKISDHNVIEKLAVILTTKNWKYLQIKALEYLLLHPQTHYQDLTYEKMSAWLESGVEESSTSHALSILSCISLDGERQVRLLDQVSRLLQDHYPSSARKFSLIAAFRIFQKNRSSTTGTRALLMVYGSLWDDDIEIRNLASELISTLLNLEHSFSPFAIAKLFPHVFIEKSSTYVDAVCGYFMDCEPRIAASIANAVQNRDDDDQLFEIEEVNLYRNNLDKCAASIKLFETVREHVSEDNLQQMINKTASDINQAITYINQMGIEGPIGWLRRKYNYESIYCTILRARVLDHGLRSDNTIEELYNLAAKLHPSFAKLLNQ